MKRKPTKIPKAPKNIKRRKRRVVVNKFEAVTLAPESTDEHGNSKWDPDNCRKVQALCALGATDYEIADFFQVTTTTIMRWQSRYKDFFEAMRRDKETADERVVRSLYTRATGYTYDSEKIINVDGVIHRLKTIEHVPPDVTACIFWLKNRRSAEWRDKTDHDHQHMHKIGLPGAPAMSVAEAQDFFRQARSMTPAELERQFKIIDGQVIKKDEAA